MAHDFKAYPELTNNQMELYYWDSPHKQITEDFRAKVIKVTDGDTIRVVWEERDFNFPIRLAEINAPEMNETGGKESKNWLEGEILGEEVDIIIDPNNRVEKWGRLLAKITHAGMDIGELSQNSGHSIQFEERNTGKIPEVKF